MSVCSEISKCRICNSTSLESVIDLGEQFLASSFVHEQVSDALNCKYPLEVVRCASDNGCGLLQLKHTINPSLMYADGYGYMSGLNESMCDNLQEYLSVTLKNDSTC